MSDQIKTAKEIGEEAAKLVAEAQELQAKKSRTEEETTHLDSILAKVEELDGDRQNAAREERLVAAKQRMAAPVKEAPKFAPAAYQAQANLQDGFHYWLGAKTKEGKTECRTPDAIYKARMAGFDDESFVHIPFRWEAMNLEKRRTMLTTGGSTTGSDYLFTSFSNELTRYMIAESPLLGYLNVVTTEDGNNRDHFVYDDRSITSAYTTDSGGTEAAPNIRAVNVTTGKVTSKCLDIESGKHNVSWKELRDAAVGSQLPGQIAATIARSHARFVESECINAVGNGQTAPMGILNHLIDIGGVNYGVDSIEDLYFSLRTPYLKNAIFLSNRATLQAVRAGLRESNGRSLLSPLLTDSAANSPEVPYLMGHPYVTSEYITGDQLCFFDPTLFVLRYAAGVGIKQFTETTWPNTAWASIISFTQIWLGTSNLYAGSMLTPGS